MEMPIKSSWLCGSVAFRDLKKKSQTMVLCDLMGVFDLRKLEHEDKLGAWKKAKKEQEDQGRPVPAEPMKRKLLTNKGMTLCA